MRYRPFQTPILCLTFACLSAGALGQVTFAPALHYNAGTNPYACIAVADFNSDGKPDIAVPNGGTDNVSVFMGHGDGTFDAAVNYTVGDHPGGVAVGDFNRDGKPDLVVTNAGADTVSLLIGSGTGTFTLHVTSFAAGNAPYSPVVTDLNNDGRGDIVLADYLGSTMCVLIANGNNSFAAAALYNTGTNPGALTLGDFNADGKTDVAVANDSDDNMSIFRGTGTGTFNAPTTFAAGDGPRGIATGDFDGDGRLDLACANYATIPTVAVMMGNGNATFDAPVTYTAGIGPWSIASGDFNADGRVDLAVANYTSGSVSILRGNGNGTFTAPMNFPTGSLTIAVVAKDIDHDGWTDIVAGNYSSNNIAVLRNTGLVSNNSCANPDPVYNGVTMNFSTVGATTDGPTDANLGFCCGDLQVNQDVWFLYTATCGGAATVSLCGSNFDTKVAVYGGSSCPTLPNSAIAGNDDFAACGNRSQTTFTCQEGAQYLIRVGGYTTNVGTVQMTVNCVAPQECGTADFDGDGDVGTDADIEAFFRVLAGGRC